MMLKDFISIDWNMMKKAVTENKDECIQWVKKYINLGIEYRSLGIEPFEKECSISQNEFEKIALEMRINGDCPEYCFTVLANLLGTNTMDCIGYFSSVVIFQFILIEYEESVSIDILVKMLGSLLGLELFSEIKLEYAQYFH